jgi:hypothetical protein
VHVTRSSLDWYVARGAGITAWVLLTLVVLLGTGLAARLSRLQPRLAVENVHRFASLLAATFVAVHVVAIAIDSWLPFTLRQLLVPLAARYRPVWTAAGIVAAELMLAIGIANRLRGRIPYRLWRRIHYGTLVVWAAATVHAVGAGTDRGAPWLVALVAVLGGVAAGAIAWRLGRRRLPASAAGVAVALVASLAGGATALAMRGPLRPATRVWNATTFHDVLTGRILVTQGATRAIVSMSGEGAGAQRLLVRADLLATPDGLASTALQVEYLPSGDVCTGTVDDVQPTGFSGTCTLADGSPRPIAASWQLLSDDRLRGTVVGG